MSLTITLLTIRGIKYFIMMNFVLYLLYSIVVQLLAEPFPVSSSGHLLLLQKSFLSLVCAQSFTAAIRVAHLPTALAVIVFYAAQWRFILVHAKRLFPIIMRACIYFFVADSITALFFFAHRLVCIVPSCLVSIGFVITGLLLFSLRWCSTNNRATVPLTLYRALVLGVAQGVAFLPGVSRLAAVFVTARWLGFSAKKSFELSWTIYLPLMLAVSLWGAIDWMSDPLLLAMTKPLVATIVIFGLCSYGLFCIAARLAQRGLFWCFSFYLIIPLLCSLLW